MPSVLIVEARFYDNIGDLLVRGAKAALEDAGAAYEHVIAPGALEVPAVVSMAAATKKFDAYVALGCVIRGETYHFEIVSNESARGLGDLSITKNLAIGNGIITAETYEQALVRANPDEGNKGGDAVRAALAVLDIQKRFKA